MEAHLMRLDCRKEMFAVEHGDYVKYKEAKAIIEKLEAKIENQGVTIEADLTIYSFDLRGKPHEDYVRHDAAKAVIEKLEARVNDLEDEVSELDEKIGDMTF